LVTVAPFRVPEHVPEPLKLKPFDPGTSPSGELNVAFPLRTHSPETVLAALADAAGTITNAAIAANAIRNLRINEPPSRLEPLPKPADRGLIAKIDV
jgi:hypothetical protein